MKWIIFCVFALVLIVSCSTNFTVGKSRYINLPTVKSKDTLRAKITRSKTKYWPDSINIWNKEINLNIQIPYPSIKFFIHATTPQRVYLRNKDLTTEIYFRILDSSWSALRNKDYRNFGPHQNP